MTTMNLVRAAFLLVAALPASAAAQAPSSAATSADGMTPLHWAVRDDDVARVTQLLRAGANANAATRYGVTPLSLAVLNGSPATTEALLKAGANAKAVSPEGQTLLMTAVRSGDPAVVRLLIAAGADVNAIEGWHQQSALMFAAAENNPDDIRVLVENGADVNARSRALDGMPPLRKTAPDTGQQGIHSTFPKGGMTALHFAARQNAVEAVLALADLGVNLDQKDPDGFTAVIFATLNGHYDLAATLIERGAGVDTTDASGRTPLFVVVDMNTFEYSFNRPTARPSGRMGPVDFATFLLKHGANPNAKLTDRIRGAKYDTPGNPNMLPGATPFFRAAATADMAMMRLLLDHGADPLVRNAVNTNALMVVNGLNWPRMERLGKEPDAIEATKLLLSLGLDVNSYNDLGQTVLHAVTQRGRPGAEDGPNTVESEQLIRFLVSQGAMLDAVDKAGRTPARMAVQTKNAVAQRLFAELAAKQPASTAASNSAR